MKQSIPDCNIPINSSSIRLLANHIYEMSNRVAVLYRDHDEMWDVNNDVGILQNTAEILNEYADKLK